MLDFLRGLLVIDRTSLFGIGLYMGVVIGVIIGLFAGLLAGAMIEDAFDILKIWDRRRRRGKSR